MKKNLSDIQRNSSIELLRIIAMIFIVISHYSVHGNIKTYGMNLGFNKILLDTTQLGGLGVAIFVMITGYFMYNKKFNVSRIVNLLLATWFYSIVINFSVANINGYQIDLKLFVKTFFPVLTSQYWFVTAYIVLMCVSPFINKLIENLNRGEFLTFIFVQVFLFSLLDTVTMSIYSAGLQGGYFAQFLMFYIIGAYLGKYKKECLLKLKTLVILCVVFGTMLMFSAIAFDIIGTKIQMFDDRSAHFYQRNSIIVVILAVTLLSVFSTIKPFSNKFVNVVSGCTFGVYLIHDNNYMREYLWGNIFDNSKYAESNYLIVHFILSVIIVYVACTVIEYIRKYVLEKYVFKNIINRINSCADLVYGRLLSIIDKSYKIEQ